MIDLRREALNCTRLLCFTAALAGCAATGNAGTLYTFGGDFVSLNNGAPDILNSMDPLGSVVPGVSPVGGGNIGFNGGLVGLGSLLYGIGNDNNGFATLYSMGTDGLGLTAVSNQFNTSGDATGVVFQNGLAVVGTTFYAIGAGASSEDLYQIGNGTATQVQTLNTFNGTYKGLAWDPTANAFYAIVAGGTTGDYLVQFALSGSASIVASLTDLDNSQIGTHLGGLADAGGGILYDIYTDPSSFTGQLEKITVNGSPHTSTLYDTQIPLAENAGIATFPPSSVVPEPATGVEACSALLVLFAIVRRSALLKRQF
jgi:hypothetical protein